MDNVPYENLVESLRLDIAHVVSLVSRFMSNPKRAQWQALKRILRYIKGSLSRVLVYGGAKEGEQDYKCLMFF